MRRYVALIYNIFFLYLIFEMKIENISTFIVVFISLQILIVFFRIVECNLKIATEVFLWTGIFISSLFLSKYFFFDLIVTVILITVTLWITCACIKKNKVFLTIYYFLIIGIIYYLLTLLVNSSYDKSIIFDKIEILKESLFLFNILYILYSIIDYYSIKKIISLRKGSFLLIKTFINDITSCKVIMIIENLFCFFMLYKICFDKFYS